jgi:hypothetical protein
MLDGDFGAVGSETIEKLHVQPEAATTPQPPSLIAENGRSVIVFIPDGSAVPGGGGTTAVTVTAAVPVLVSLNAVIVALPAAMAVTSPDAETVLMAGLLELQVITRPVNMLLLASRVTAASWIVAPT